MCLPSQRFFCCELHCRPLFPGERLSPRRDPINKQAKPRMCLVRREGFLLKHLSDEKRRISISGPTTNDSVCPYQGTLSSPNQSMLSASLAGFWLFLEAAVWLHLNDEAEAKALYSLFFFFYEPTTMGNILVLNLTKKTKVATAKPLYYKWLVVIQSVLGSNQLSSSSYHLDSTLRIACLEGNVQPWAKQCCKQGSLPAPLQNGHGH